MMALWKRPALLGAARCTIGSCTSRLATKSDIIGVSVSGRLRKVKERKRRDEKVPSKSGDVFLDPLETSMLVLNAIHASSVLRGIVQ